MSHIIVIQPKGLQFTAEPHEDLLTAAQRAGITIRKSCTNGVCEICRCQLIAGVVDTPEGIRDPQHPDVNPLLTCVSKARSDLILELDKVLGPGEIPVQHIAFQIQNIAELSGGVHQISLLAPAGKLPQFHAGQYLELLVDGGEYPFTIASAPGSRELELHLGVSSDNQTSQMILKHLQTNSTVRVRLAKGDVWTAAEHHLHNLHDPLVFVVAGTGFSQAKAMIEEQLKHQHSRLYLYWVNKDCSGFYSSLAQEWADSGLIKYQAICSDNTDCSEHESRTVEACIADDFADLSHIRVVACGGPGFVFSVLDGLEENGLKAEQMQSDVFAYAQRPAK